MSDALPSVMERDVAVEGGGTRCADRSSGGTTSGMFPRDRMAPGPGIASGGKARDRAAPRNKWHVSEQTLVPAMFLPTCRRPEDRGPLWAISGRSMPPHGEAGFRVGRPVKVRRPLSARDPRGRPRSAAGTAGSRRSTVRDRGWRETSRRCGRRVERAGRSIPRTARGGTEHGGSAPRVAFLGRVRVARRCGRVVPARPHRHGHAHRDAPAPAGGVDGRALVRSRGRRPTMTDRPAPSWF